MVNREPTLVSCLFTAAILLSACGGPLAVARTTTAEEARLAVAGWLSTDSMPLDTTLGRHILAIETYTDEDGLPIYYIVYLDPLGFVIAPADDLVEPIVAFTDGLVFDPSSQTPLGDLVTQDLTSRVKAARAASESQMQLFAVSDTQSKWYQLINLAQTSADDFAFMSLDSVSDVRVSPLVKSKWSQEDVCDEYCYNYYTPNHYVCGCVATAMAQLMRYNLHPKLGVGQLSFVIEIDGVRRSAYLRGGDGAGGPYSWPYMVLLPGCSTTEIQRSAIGALCYDVGVSISTSYESTGSAASILDAKKALTTTFRYTNAVTGYNEGRAIGSGLQEMINPNLDAQCPVIIGIIASSSSTGHAVLVDGYGYNASTLYHHLNMGWSGMDDVWYNLPDVLEYNIVRACIYNVFVDHTGEIISGRVLDPQGDPIETATVIAEGSGGPYTADTNAKGIYALVGLSSSSSFTVSVTKAGFTFESQVVKTGTSRDLSNKSGNNWQIDFVAALAGDFNADGMIDLTDLATLASAWFSQSGDPAWNSEYDISDPKDDVIDPLDMAIFAENWLQ
jgi:hypothetical protein